MRRPAGQEDREGGGCEGDGSMVPLAGFGAPSPGHHGGLGTTGLAVF